MAQSEDERRENQRKWAADKRAVLRAERDAERAAARADAVTNASRTQRDAFATSIAAAKWMKDSDGAAVELARMLCEEFDYATYLHDHVLEMRIAGQLTSLLGQLGLTPVVRLRLELRSVQLAARTATESAEAAPPAPAAPPLPANVSKLTRPAKRDGGTDRG